MNNMGLLSGVVNRCKHSSSSQAIKASLLVRNIGFIIVYFMVLLYIR